MSEISFSGPALCFTGHRPHKLGGYAATDNKKLLWALSVAVEKKINLGIEVFITGMALGIDMWAAKIVLKLKEKYPHIKLVAAVPCPEQSERWSKEDQQMHKEILSKADEVHIISPYYYPQCMQRRNAWMVDRSGEVIAVWDGSRGGTGNCVKSARSKRLTIINPKDYR